MKSKFFPKGFFEKNEVSRQKLEQPDQGVMSSSQISEELAQEKNIRNVKSIIDFV